MRKHLLIDADDTLWENNIYFEQAIEAFVNFLNHSSLRPEQVRAVVDDVERIMGYGSVSFGHSLQETYRRLAEREVRDEDLARVRRFATQITEHPMQIIRGVPETLAYLAPRHELILLTKGQQEEQQLKIDSSGLSDYFQHILIVPEKDVETYSRLVNELELNPEQTWMIGNSPRSDINPALQAGLNAVFIPHEHTWGLEKQALLHNDGPRLLTLATFSELCSHF